MNRLVFCDYSDIYEQKRYHNDCDTIVIDQYLFDLTILNNFYFPNVSSLIIKKKLNNLKEFRLLNFPKLKRVKIIDNDTVIGTNNMILNNPIKKLEISSSIQNSDILISNPQDIDNMISLESLSIKGYIILKLSMRLIYLQHLDISNNRYIKKLPYSYVNLKSLNIQNCKSIKNIPESYINLETLHASNSGLVNINKSLINLKYVECFNSDLSKIDLSCNNVLEYLDIGRTNVRKLNLWNSIKLKHLNIKDSRTYIIARDNFLQNLTYLNIDNNKSFYSNSSILYLPKLKNLIANNVNDNICNLLKLDKNKLTELQIGFVECKEVDLLTNFIGNNIESMKISKNIFFANKFINLTFLVLTDLKLDRLNCPNLKVLHLIRSEVKNIKNLELLEALTSTNSNKFPDIKSLNNLTYVSNHLITCDDKDLIKFIDIDYKHNSVIVHKKEILNYISQINIKLINALIIYDNSLLSIPLCFSNIKHLEWYGNEFTKFNHIHPSFTKIELVYVSNTKNIVLSNKFTNLHTLVTDDIEIINNKRKIIKHINKKKNLSECNICFEMVGNNITLNCGHQLCIDCLEKISACPYCRIIIT